MRIQPFSPDNFKLGYKKFFGVSTNFHAVLILSISSHTGTFYKPLHPNEDLDFIFFKCVLHEFWRLTERSLPFLLLLLIYRT